VSHHVARGQIRCRIFSFFLKKREEITEQSNERKHKLMAASKGGGKCTGTHMDCRLLSSPMAVEISPPRFRFDRFLFVHSEQSHQKIIPWRQKQPDEQGEEAASFFCNEMRNNARSTVPLNKDHYFRCTARKISRTENFRASKTRCTARAWLVESETFTVCRP
jgi:hypothetical protein